MELKHKIAKIQFEIDGLSKKEDNPFFKSKYVDLNQIIDAIRPLEVENQISITTPLTNVGGLPAIALCITDLENDAEDISFIVPLPQLTDPQKMGSAITYYRRYMLMSYFNLKAEDDDGNFASKPTPARQTNATPPKNKETITNDLDFLN